MEYDYRNTYYYKPELNGPGLTGNEYVVVAHPLLLAMALGINVDREDLLPLVNNAMNELLNHPKDNFTRERFGIYFMVELNWTVQEMVLK